MIPVEGDISCFTPVEQRPIGIALLRRPIKRVYITRTNRAR